MKESMIALEWQLAMFARSSITRFRIGAGILRKRRRLHSSEARLVYIHKPSLALTPSERAGSYSGSLFHPTPSG